MSRESDGMEASFFRTDAAGRERESVVFSGDVLGRTLNCEASVTGTATVIITFGRQRQDHAELW